MRTSEKQNSLVQALFAAIQVFPKIAKTKEGQAGNRKFSYTPLEGIKDVVDPILWANGLFITQGTEGASLVTRLEHAASGEWREISMPVNVEHANMQSYGIELTYCRRYSVPMILGLMTEDDTDVKTKNRTKGADHTDPSNENGTKQAGFTDNPKREAFNKLQPDIQDALRQAAPHVDRAIPDVAKAIQIASMALDSWPDQDRHELKMGLWYLLDSKTRTAIDKQQKAR